MDFTPELFQKAVGARDAGELEALARSEGLELTGAEAENYFGKLHPPAGELADDELEAVSGGGCGGGALNAPGETVIGEDKQKEIPNFPCPHVTQKAGVYGGVPCHSISYQYVYNQGRSYIRCRVCGTEYESNGCGGYRRRTPDFDSIPFG